MIRSRNFDSRTQNRRGSPGSDASSVLRAGLQTCQPLDLDLHCSPPAPHDHTDGGSSNRSIRRSCAAHFHAAAERLAGTTLVVPLCHIPQSLPCPRAGPPKQRCFSLSSALRRPNGRQDNLPHVHDAPPPARSIADRTIRPVPGRSLITNCNYVIFLSRRRRTKSSWLRAHHKLDETVPDRFI